MYPLLLKAEWNGNLNTCIQQSHLSLCPSSPWRPLNILKWVGMFLVLLRAEKPQPHFYSSIFTKELRWKWGVEKTRKWEKALWGGAKVSGSAPVSKTHLLFILSGIVHGSTNWTYVFHHFISGGKILYPIRFLDLTAAAHCIPLETTRLCPLPDTQQWLLSNSP